MDVESSSIMHYVGVPRVCNQVVADVRRVLDLERCNRCHVESVVSDRIFWVMDSLDNDVERVRDRDIADDQFVLSVFLQNWTFRLPMNP